MKYKFINKNNINPKILLFNNNIPYLYPKFFSEATRCKKV